MAVKQVLVVRSDLNMVRGKEDAQVSHAAMLFMVARLKLVGELPQGRKIAQFVLNPAECEWLFNQEFTKVTLVANSLEQLLQVRDHAEALGVVCHVVEDQGKTNAGNGVGVPTITCLALGPAEVSVIDEITGPQGRIPLRLR